MFVGHRKGYIAIRYVVGRDVKLHKEMTIIPATELVEHYIAGVSWARHHVVGHGRQVFAGLRHKNIDGLCLPSLRTPNGD